MSLIKKDIFIERFVESIRRQLMRHLHDSEGFERDYLDEANEILYARKDLYIGKEEDGDNIVD